MKLFVNYLVKIFSGLVFICGSIAGGIKWFDYRDESRLAVFAQHLREERSAWREKTRVDMIAGDEILSARIVGVEKTMNSIDKNVRVLLRIQLKKISEQDFQKDPLYTKTKNQNEVDTL